MLVSLGLLQLRRSYILPGLEPDSVTIQDLGTRNGYKTNIDIYKSVDKPYFHFVTNDYKQ